MGLAFDSVLAAAVNPGAGGAVATVTASGDPLSVRNFADGQAAAYLELITRMGTTAGFAQVQSPLFHDNVQGIRITPAESPSVYGIPGLAAEQLHPQDTLQVTLSGGAAETDIAVLHNYYTDLPGASARLHSWGDIAGIIAHIKPIRIAVTTSATIGAWQDTVITTTENLLKANTDYAVLGYMSNTALGAVGLKGPDTSNLRATGPGSTQEFPTTNYFAYLSQARGLPFIPVFNAANANATFVCTCAATASVAAVVELICAQLSQNLPS
jgi:hypothetical protein